MNVDGMQPEEVEKDIKDLEGYRIYCEVAPFKLEPKHIVMYENIVSILFDNDPTGIKHMSEIMTAYIYGDEAAVVYGGEKRDFEAEAAHVVFCMNDWESSDQLKSIIETCLWQMLRETYNDEYIAKIAREIWNAWLKYQGLPPLVYKETYQLPGWKSRKDQPPELEESTIFVD